MVAGVGPARMAMVAVYGYAYVQPQTTCSHQLLHIRYSFLDKPADNRTNLPTAAYVQLFRQLCVDRWPEMRSCKMFSRWYLYDMIACSAAIC